MRNPLQKVMALILVAVMMLGMTACGGGQKGCSITMMRQQVCLPPSLDRSLYLPPPIPRIPLPAPTPAHRVLPL